MDQDIEAAMPDRLAAENIALIPGEVLLNQYFYFEFQSRVGGDEPDPGRADALRSEILRRLRLVEPPRFT